MYILMGLAGSGKGTQGEMLAGKLDYDYFSTGDYLRTFLTKDRKREMLEGKLLDDQEMIGIITSYLESLQDKSKTILDGFPRTLLQAQWLHTLHLEQGLTIEGVIFLDVPEKSLIDRLFERARPDDTLDAIKKRFAHYNESTQPVIDFFKGQAIQVWKIDGQKDIESVQKSIISQINQGKQAK